MKKILGLDLGTNSIGWALVDQNFEEKQGNILGLGSRIIPMSQDILGDFDKGNSISQTAERTGFRGVRRLRERHLQRRERLHRVLNLLGFLPQHYSDKIDFGKRMGKFLPETETKLVYNEQNDFIFKKSFEEMLHDFRKSQPDLVTNGRKVPFDWTIYYLRQKALTAKIEKEELAWLLLNFNQKRGYYQLRGDEEEENQNKLVEFHSLKVVDVTADAPQKGKSEIWYSIMLENGWIYRRASKNPMFDWKNKTKDFIVTTDLNDDKTVKTDKDGKEKRSFRAPNEDDWTLRKKKTESEIEKTRGTVGQFIYNTLLWNPNQKIKGKLIRTIERKFYKEELKQILTKQVEFHPELKNTDFYNACIEELYPHNESHKNSLQNKDFVHLFIEDILFYQRPLRSQKSLISNCSFEYRSYVVEGIKKSEPIKCVSKSHPVYQEFRLWQWIQNLKIYTRQMDENVTPEYLFSEDDYVRLFDFLNERKEVEQKILLKYFKISEKTHRWNFVEEKKYPCNETHSMIKSRLEKVENFSPGFLTPEIEEKLWHLIYSVNDKIEYEKALKSFAVKYKLNAESFLENFRKFPPFKNEYGAYSLKAVKKLLPLMRMGKYWNNENIDSNTKVRIQHLLTGEFDESIRERVRDKAITLTNESDFKGLPLWLTSYIVYDRHSENAEIGKWNSVKDLENHLASFRQHSLRNPIVEQVITETLRVVKDIWSQFGSGEKDFFNEIHIELGREMKNPADKRKKMTERIAENENTNLRIKALLMEMLNDSNVENVRPYSPMQQEILKIYEEGVLNSDTEIPEEIEKISKQAQPSGSDLMRYKLWLEQKYRSPYTGEIIPLNKLFTPAYEIEHIIPQSRYFDDSLSNKVICEAAVNKEKTNQTGLEFIKNHHGQIIETDSGKKVRIFSEDEYQEFVKLYYNKNRGKRNKLLLDDIPEKMIERQMNDTRYISKFVMQLLSNIVREETSKDDGVNSKNVLASNGQITSVLKTDWGLNNIWNDLIIPRFERLNELTKSQNFTTYNERYQKYLPAVPLELQKGFQKKRIDHRHHAMDALVIACATRNHINYLNNQNALDKKKSKDQKQVAREDLRAILCDKKYNNGSNSNYQWVFKQPWETFIPEAKQKLETTVVSFKQNLRVINKTTNKYEKYINKEGKWLKEKVEQTTGDSWAIRKPMHKDTVAGHVNLRERKRVNLSAAIDKWEMLVDKNLKTKIKQLINEGFDKKKIVKFFADIEYKWMSKDVSKPELYYFSDEKEMLVASRVSLDVSFNEAKINSITDTGIRKILLKHLEQKQNNPEVAFSPEGIEEMNQNLTDLNDGKPHQPIIKVRTFEPKGNKFSVGQSGNKKEKYVEAAKGTNLFFAIYLDKEGKRSYETIPLNIVIERQKQGLAPCPEVNADGLNLLFYLSPNDLVYVPTQDQLIQQGVILEDDILHNRIYKFMDSSDTIANFIPNSFATTIFKINKNEQLKLGIKYPIQNELGVGSPQSKNQKALTGEMIKDVCIKLRVDRLGNISL
ncbi:MAG: type II CRISPR RNA-guided endonuclease Cas9 [Lentimicrobium sp.]|nr:type II CRISPR RNA-guided endonuclease Cas9 [Lentimicrobium sp.]